VVVERDVDLRATGGYKLHLGPPALAALRELLPAALVERLYGSSVGTRGFRIDVRDHRARLLARVGDAPGELSVDVDRVTLRLILATGLGERLVTGRTVESWSRGDESVTAVLDDGTTFAGDVLVLADGANSPLAGTLAGAPATTPTGMVGVAGRTQWTLLDTEVRDLVGEASMLAIGPGGVGLFAAAHDPAGRPAARLDPPVPDLPEACVIWGLIATEEALPRAGGSLKGQVMNALGRRRWAPSIRRLIRDADPGSIGRFRLWGSDPARLAPWPASRVTALGDAVHAMPPTGGQGAATAILDAASLVDGLARAGRGETGVVTAILDHEIRMRAHAAPAVRESLQPLGWIRGTAHPLGAGLARAVLPIAATAARAYRLVRA
jgi:salicylate hydroxylase